MIQLITRKDAKASGMVHCFTGRPCKNGNVALRRVSSGMCTCETCLKDALERSYAWKKENKDRYNELNRIRASTPEAKRKQAEYDKIRAEKYPEKLREAKKAWYQSNRDRILESKKPYRKLPHVVERARELGRVAYARNPDKFKKAVMGWRRNNPEKASMYARVTRSRRRSSEGRHRAEDVIRILSTQKWTCVYCKTSLKGGYEVDHIMPIARGGTNWPDNLQALCVPCNRSKHAQHPVDFAQKHGMLL